MKNRTTSPVSDDWLDLDQSAPRSFTAPSKLTDIVIILQMKPIPSLSAGFAVFIIAILPVAPSTLSQPAKAERVVIEYVAPTHPVLEPLRDILRSKQALERVRELLLNVKWPRTLRLELRDCNGEANAGYENAVITVCYELLDDFWRNANARGRPSSITREDAFVGQSLNVLLHEAAHALFRLFNIPILGQEEDAADQLSGYILLQLPKDRKRNLVLGSAYAFSGQLNIRSARELNRPRVQFGRYAAFADEHGTPAQRLYSLLCLAYGSDKVLFAAIVDKGFLTKERAGICVEEYHQVDFAYKALIGPHVDSSP
jgi:hypothetical protein